MPLKVIGAGFGRTGTLSLCTAFNRLGFPSYHMFQIFERSSPRFLSLFSKESRAHVDFWHRVANGKVGSLNEWEQIFSGYTSVAGPPQGDVWRDLFSAYPDAKVVLTVHPRGADAWYESTIATIYWLTETRWQFRLLRLLTPSGKKLGDLGRKLVWQGSLKGTITDRRKAIERYHEHIAEVKALVPPEQLLVYSVDQGWKPLCAFLGVPEPDEEFPNINERVSLRQWIREFTSGAYVILAVGTLVLAGVIYALARVL